jgi:hypothetical protein
LLALIGRQASQPAQIGKPTYLVSLKAGLSNDPRRALAMLERRESAVLDQTADGGLAYGKGRGRLVKRRFAALGAFAITINGDAVLMAQGANTSSCPLFP